MVLALALVFVFVLCCLPASASSVKRNITNGQHKSIRKDYNSLSSNPIIWPFATESIRAKYVEICQKCVANGNCESKIRTFCTLPSANCNAYLPILTRSCGYYGASCIFDHQCEYVWRNSVCNFQKCYCKRNFFFNFADQTCSPLKSPTTTPAPTTRIIKTNTKSDNDDYGSACRTKYNCRWTDMVCESRRCVCPSNSRPNYFSKYCVKNYVTNNSYKNTKSNYIIGLAIACMLVLLCMTVCICLSRKRSPDRSSNGDSRPIGVSALTGTSSTLELLGGLADLPPEYSDIYMVTPQGRAGEQNYKLPTYDEAVRLPEWNSQPLYVVGQSSEEERNSPLTLRTDDDQPQNHDYPVDSSESDGRINHGYVAVTFTL